MEQKTFVIQTKNGQVTARVTGPNHIFVESQNPNPICIRNIDYTGNIRFVLIGDTWKGQTWINGESTQMPANPTDWNMVQAVWLRRAGSHEDPSIPARVKFYRDTTEALNSFWRTHTEEINAELRARKLELVESQWEKAQAEVNKTLEAYEEAQRVLAEAKKNLEATRLLYGVTVESTPA